MIVIDRREFNLRDGELKFREIGVHSFRSILGHTVYQTPLKPSICIGKILSADCNTFGAMFPGVLEGAWGAQMALGSFDSSEDLLLKPSLSTAAA